MSCSKCNQDKPIVNKKHNLCDDCNFMRLHNGQTKAEVYSERAKDKEPKVYRFKNTSSLKKKPKAIKQQTAKEKSRKEQLSQLKAEIEERAISNNEYYCWGCGKSGIPLDKSHILSVKQRKDLELDKDNINLFCRESHMDWESWDIVRMIKLLTFEKDLHYIQKKDKQTFNKILEAIEYWITHNDLLNTDQDLLEKAKRIYSQSDYMIL